MKLVFTREAKRDLDELRAFLQPPSPKGLAKVVHSIELRIINGLAVSDGSTDAGLVRLYDSTGTFLGVGERYLDGTLIPKRLVSQAAAIKKIASGIRLSP